MPVGTTQVGPADLSKTELRTEASMTQLGRTAESGSSIDHVWFVLSSVSRQTNHLKKPNKTKVKQHTKLAKTNGTMQKQRDLLSADKLPQLTNEPTQEK